MNFNRLVLKLICASCVTSIFFLVYPKPNWFNRLFLKLTRNVHVNIIISWFTLNVNRLFLKLICNVHWNIFISWFTLNHVIH